MTRQLRNKRLYSPLQKLHSPQIVQNSLVYSHGPRLRKRSPPNLSRNQDNGRISSTLFTALFLPSNLPDKTQNGSPEEELKITEQLISKAIRDFPSINIDQALPASLPSTFVWRPSEGRSILVSGTLSPVQVNRGTL
ncbi:unnamed protein product [Larinioides sclopetarius]|uniref:Uncharacterized protein n=1 Tax=Larinioides sclopetarius TaxID=280406 RepID=A0AAV1ZUD6_9ARAC